MSKVSKVSKVSKTTEAVIRTPSGAHQTYRRKPADPLHPAERCLVWDLADA